MVVPVSYRKMGKAISCYVFIRRMMLLMLVYNSSEALSFKSLFSILFNQAGAKCCALDLQIQMISYGSIMLLDNI